MAPPGCVNAISDCIFTSEEICDDKNKTCYEFIHMYEKCYKERLQLDDCMERFQICGPVPLAVFSSKTASSLKSELDIAISRNGYYVLSSAMARNSMLSMMETKELSSKILLPIVDETFELKGVAPCSDYVANELFNYYHSEHYSSMIPLSNDLKEGFGSLWEKIFERHVLNALCPSTVVLDCITLANDDAKTNVSFTVSELRKVTFSNYEDLSTIMKSHSYERKLLCPASKTFGAIDALFVTDSDIWLLQITRDIYTSWNQWTMSSTGCGYNT